MGRKLFGIDVQKEIASAMPKVDCPFVGTLVKTPEPTENPTELSGPGTPGTPVEYDVRGFVLEYALEEAQRSPGVLKGDKKILLIAKPLADAGVQPESEDVIVDADTGLEYTVVTAKTDAATAKWICQCRGR